MTHIDFILLVPELFQLVLINALLLYALFFSSLGQSSQITSEVPLSNLSLRPQQLIRTAYLPTPLQIVEPLSWLIVLSLLFSAALYLNTPINSAIILTNSFICDNYGTLFKVLLCLASAAAIALALPARAQSATFHTSGSESYEFILIIYLAVLGMLALISSYNFLTLYLSIELQSLSFYMLACMKARSEFSAEAGLKYFILGAFSSAILLFGISLIYGSVGSIYFDDIAALLNFLQYSPQYTGLNSLAYSSDSEITFPYITQFVGLMLGLICICISLLFKLAAAPFHAWAPDVYEGSPMNITAFFAISAKIAALAVLLRLVVSAGDMLTNILSLVAIASLVIGTLSAMRQVKIKRLIAFSGIANVGWFLVGLCCGGLDAIILHLIVYIVLSITLFTVLIIPIRRVNPGVSDYGEITNISENMTIKHISDLGQVYKTNPMVALALTIAFFSLGGIPILAGFYSKYLIINATIQADALGLLSVALLSTVFSAFYYIRVIKTMYFSSVGSDWFSFSAPTTINAYLISITSLFSTLFIVYPECLSIWLIYISF